MSKRTIKILCLFDYACTTGFATVSHNIVKELKKRFGSRLFLDIVAINYFDTAFQQDANTTIFPAGRLEEGTKWQDPYGRYGFLKLLQDQSYDAVFMIQDMGVVLPMVPNMQEIMEKKVAANAKRFKSIFYFPVDGNLVQDKFLNGFNFFDVLVPYTEYGRNQILQFNPMLREKMQVILHGVNPKHFYPLPEERRLKFRKEYFGVNAEKYIVTNVNRNQPRKDIPTTIFGFELFKTTYCPNALLYLHMTPKDEMGWNLPRVLKQTSLEEGKDYIFPSEDSHNAAAKIETVNAVYNSSDVFLSTTSGEGFGLTILEAMMCKCPVIAPNHTSISEIGGNGRRIWTLEEFYPYCTHFDNDIRYQSDFREVAEMLEHVRNSGTERKEKIDQAYKYASSLSWDAICERWVDVFEKI